MGKQVGSAEFWDPVKAKIGSVFGTVRGTR